MIQKEDLARFGEVEKCEEAGTIFHVVIKRGFKNNMRNTCTLLAVISNSVEHKFPLILKLVNDIDHFELIAKSNEPEEKVLTISKINFIDKWVEFWFDEEKKYQEIFDDEGNPTGEKSEQWLHCDKAGLLWDEVEKSNISNSIHNHGFVGKKVKWVYESPNWNFKGFV